MLSLQKVRKEYDRYDEGWVLLSFSNDNEMLEDITFSLQDLKIVSMLLDYRDENINAGGFSFLYVRPQDEMAAKVIVEQYKIY
ncbi:hypothetical protein K4L44_13320 [Halosquirtibacter laminarini]|uniref:Uncharacterized protein n=1 Tax=Halosquirtibacter laminarini TaxID=3374600 RepID=A0AC61NM78_9BACT|nr:hypothetical protein K4L44_13320 [Prolixibacteraceae bacterium]